jgi:hypothetical protein
VSPQPGLKILVPVLYHVLLFLLLVRVFLDGTSTCPRAHCCRRSCVLARVLGIELQSTVAHLLSNQSVRNLDVFTSLQSH